MKIFYLANARIPTEKAHGVQIIKMCEAFAKLGHEVELVVPRRFNKIKTDTFKFYDIKADFKITRLPCLDFIPWSTQFGSLALWLEMTSFLLSAKIYSFFKKFDLCYTREWYAGILFRNFILEIHSLPKKTRWWHKKLLNRAKKIAVLTNFIKQGLEKMGVDSKKIVVAPDGVDLEKFSTDITKTECRDSLSLPTDKQIVLYAGHLYWWKGAETLLQAAKFTHDQAIFVFVGGVEEDVRKFKEQVEKLGVKDKVMVLGYRPYSEMPCFMKAADLLVLPNSAKEDISLYYTSPMKLFEYMASGTPVIASDLFSLREVLHDRNSYLVKADDHLSFAEAINDLHKNPAKGQQLANQALEEIKKYDWQNRAKNIINFCF